jgi:hypothetical protein
VMSIGVPSSINSLYDRRCLIFVSETASTWPRIHFDKTAIGGDSFPQVIQDSFRITISSRIWAAPTRTAMTTFRSGGSKSMRVVAATVARVGRRPTRTKSLAR